MSEPVKPPDRRAPTFTFEGFGTKFSLTGASIRTFIDTAIFGAMAAIAVLVWQGRSDVHAIHTAIVASNRETTAALKYLACITSMPESEREKEYGRSNGRCLLAR